MTRRRKAGGGTIVWRKGEAYARVWATVEGKRRRLWYSLGTSDPVIARRRLDTLVRDIEAGRATVGRVPRDRPPGSLEGLSDVRPPTTKGVYFIYCAGRVKIGHSANVAKRLGRTTLMPEHPQLLAVLPGGRRLEQELHARFAAARAHGEWFEPTIPLVELILHVRGESHAA